MEPHLLMRLRRRLALPSKFGRAALAHFPLDRIGSSLSAGPCGCELSSFAVILVDDVRLISSSLDNFHDGICHCKATMEWFWLSSYWLLL